MDNYKIALLALIFIGNGMFISDAHTSIYLKGKYKDTSMKYTPYFDFILIIIGLILFIINSI